MFKSMQPEPEMMLEMEMEKMLGTCMEKMFVSSATWS